MTTQSMFVYCHSSHTETVATTMCTRYQQHINTKLQIHHRNDKIKNEASSNDIINPFNTGQLVIVRPVTRRLPWISWGIERVTVVLCSVTTCLASIKVVHC